MLAESPTEAGGFLGLHREPHACLLVTVGHGSCEVGDGTAPRGRVTDTCALQPSGAGRMAGYGRRPWRLAQEDSGRALVRAGPSLTALREHRPMVARLPAVGELALGPVSATLQAPSWACWGLQRFPGDGARA